MCQKVYLIFEINDYCDTVLFIYRSKESAETHCEELEKEYKELWGSCQDKYFVYEFDVDD